MSAGGDQSGAMEKAGGLLGAVGSGTSGVARGVRG